MRPGVLDTVVAEADADRVAFWERAADRLTWGERRSTAFDRSTPVKVYAERLTYGFSRIGAKGLKAAVPAGAANLLRTTFPTLTTKQRTSVLAQTELKSVHPLDGTRTMPAPGSG